MIEQITVFLENSEGRLASMCRCLAQADINMSALTIADTTDFGIARIIANNPEAAVAALKGADYRAAITSVTAVAVPNTPGGLADLLEALDRLSLNIEYGYCFSMNGENAIDVLKIRGAKEAEEAEEALRSAGFTVLAQSDLQ